MLWEIINPSDECTLEAPDFEVACVACLFLGEGKYGLTPEDGADEHELGVFIFGGAVEWFQEHFGKPIGDVLKDRNTEVAACLESIVYGDFGSRRELLKTLAVLPEDACEKYREEWQDRRQSSVNAIVAYGKRLAKRMRVP